ncbi:MAG: UDP-N-acetylmuramoyl-L-alanine--D-glutamate ligase [Bryobacterales bacterium]|nr:UDP-N-acetylmuramoyl-L-alanine--D-glutamate ligase [Bryobacteraceae bacterium]MDW8131162.1 UDP-N-acetylmuramoyl-L-alanine--D-glutamate ligase [Bryobacterales bacterium]
MNFAGVRVLVVGLGRSGQAAVELLLAQGARVCAADLTPPAGPVLERLREAGVEFRPQSPEVFREAHWIVLSPGVPADLPELEEARGRGARVIGEVELASYYLRGPVLGITGSNGKTTTTALTGHILRHAGIPVQVGGNIGIPACSLVASSRADQWNVLELSSFQLETIERFRAHVAVGLNLTPDHLDRHRTFENYAAKKARLFETQRPGDHAVLNRDDPACAAWARRTPAAVHWFSLRGDAPEGACLRENTLWLGGRPLMPASDIPLRGLHNVENVLAAALAARLTGAPAEAIAEAVRSFPGVEHRLEFVCRVRGVEFYNDSKATNVDAALKALQAFEGPLWVILGGKDKDGDFRPLREPLRQKARAVLLIGAAAEKIARQLEGAVPLASCGTLENAVEYAFRRAVPGDTVLLAPACASFDQFENFEHRGRVFKQLVASLAARSAAEES